MRRVNVRSDGHRSERAQERADGRASERTNGRAVVDRVAMGLAAVALGAACPEARECRAQNDCPPDFGCSVEGTCVEIILPDAGPRPDAGVAPGPGGGGGRPFNARFETEAPITMFTRGPSSSRAYLAQGGDDSWSVDRVDVFDLGNTSITETFRDFRTGGPSCFVDTLRAFPESTVELPAGDETWFACAAGTQVEQAEAGFLQRMTMSDVPTELATLIPSLDGTNLDADARLISARRGGSELYVTLFNSGVDALGRERTVETIDVPFTSIAGVFVLAEGDALLGDVLLVFDRSSPPRLVPIQRPPRTETFLGPGELVGTDLQPLTLPAGTHYAWFREDVGIRNLRNLAEADAQDRELANVVLFMPTLGSGTIRLLRYEAEQLGPGTNAFIDLDLRAGEPSAIELPAADDRILIDARTVDDDVIVTYALTRSSHVWRFPLPRGRSDDRNREIQRVRFSTEDLPIGVLPVPGRDDLVWVAFSNRRAIEALPLVAPF